MKELEDSSGSLAQRRINLVVTILLVLAVVLCLYAVTQVLSYGYVNVGGFMMFRVVTGSMEPTIPVNALIVTQVVDIHEIAYQDIICFRTQESEIWGKIVTHRVVEILQAENGNILLATKGDANPVADGYYVDQNNFVGKVIWHTGDGSMLANIFSLFTSKIGFLGCIVLPIMVLATMILRDSVSTIRNELQTILEESERLEQQTSWEDDPLCGMTQEEYNEMYERIRAELMEELMQLYAEIQKEQTAGAQVSEDK